MRSSDFHLRLPCEPDSVQRARAGLRAWCRRIPIDGDLLADLQLAVTEAAANAVRHSGCAFFEVDGWIRRGGLILSVWDNGRGKEDADPGLGVGLAVIRALAKSVDYETTDPGTRVTMRFARNGDRTDNSASA